MLGTVEAAETMSSASMWLADLTSGEEVVRYPICDGCEARGGGIFVSLEEHSC